MESCEAHRDSSTIYMEHHEFPKTLKFLKGVGAALRASIGSLEMQFFLCSSQYRFGVFVITAHYSLDRWIMYTKLA